MKAWLTLDQLFFHPSSFRLRRTLSVLSVVNILSLAVNG
jgi:hypothetical protein